MPLGKNLENILGDYFGDQGIELNSTSIQVVEIELDKIKRNPHQTRKHFEESKIIALAKNIDKNGLINPITVLKDSDGYVLLAGERRLRAFQYLGKKTIPSIVKDPTKLSDDDQFLVSASENIQRENLNAVELAKTIKILMEKNRWNMRKMADSIGTSEQYVMNHLNLLKFNVAIQDAIAKGLIGEAHGRMLGQLPHDLQPVYLERVIHEKLSKRALTDLIAEVLGKANKIQSTGTWAHSIHDKTFKQVEHVASLFPHAKVQARGSDKKGKIVLTWGGYKD